MFSTLVPVSRYAFCNRQLKFKSWNRLCALHSTLNALAKNMNPYIFPTSYSLVRLYGISIILGYLMSNSVYTYILNLKTHFIDYIFKRSWAHFLHTVKWFQVLLCITNNSIKYQSSVYTQLNDQTVLFLTIQFSISHLHTVKCQKFYYR